MSENQNENVKLKVLPLADIEENPVALRNVNRKSKDYASLVESIRLKGILNPILVRELGKDPETAKMRYAVIDGLQRYSASLDAGKKEIPCMIRNLDDANVWEAQIITNAVRVETRPHEYASHLQRIFTQNPTLTASELAARLGRSPEWISKMLGLVRIKDDKIGSLINTGKIVVSNAYALSKLPEEEHANWIDRAMTESPASFIPLAEARAKQIKDDRRKGKDTSEEKFVAVPTLRKLKELKEEKVSTRVGPQLLKQFNIETPLDAWKLAVDWALNLDPNTIEIRKQKELERKELQKQEKDKLKKEKEEVRRREAAEKMAEVQA